MQPKGRNATIQIGGLPLLFGLLIPQAPGAGTRPGDVLVTDWQVSGVIRVNPFTGDQAVVSVGGFLSVPLDVELAPR